MLKEYEPPMMLGLTNYLIVKETELEMVLGVHKEGKGDRQCAMYHEVDSNVEKTPLRVDNELLPTELLAFNTQ